MLALRIGIGAPTAGSSADDVESDDLDDGAGDDGDDGDDGDADAGDPGATDRGDAAAAENGRSAPRRISRDGLASSGGAFGNVVILRALI